MQTVVSINNSDGALPITSGRQGELKLAIIKSAKDAMHSSQEELAFPKQFTGVVIGSSLFLFALAGGLIGGAALADSPTMLIGGMTAGAFGLGAAALSIPCVIRYAGYRSSEEEEQKAAFTEAVGGMGDLTPADWRALEGLLKQEIGGRFFHSGIWAGYDDARPKTPK